jgi:hypothetical protein
MRQVLLVLLLVLARVQVPGQRVQLAVSVHSFLFKLIPSIEPCLVALHEDLLRRIDGSSHSTSPSVAKLV